MIQPRVSEFILLTLLAWFSLSDIRVRKVSPFIILAIVGFAIIRQSYIEAILFYILALIVGLYDFKFKRILCRADMRAWKNERTNTQYRGGDAWLMTMNVAALGKIGLATVILSWGILWACRHGFNLTGPLPYAPFLLVSTFMLTVEILR